MGTETEREQEDGTSRNLFWFVTYRCLCVDVIIINFTIVISDPNLLSILLGFVPIFIHVHQLFCLIETAKYTAYAFTLIAFFFSK